MSKGNIFFNIQIRSTEYAGNKIKDQIKKSVNTVDMHDYYDRDEACDKSYDEGIDTKDAFDYYNYRIGSTGCFNGKGKVESDEYFNKMKKYKPEIVYRCVFSFPPEFALENDIMDPYKMRNLIKKTMSKNIKAMGFDVDNVEWFAFYHTNTGHPHVHFHFYEKDRKKKRFIIAEDRLLKVKSNVGRLMNLNTTLYAERDQNKKEIIDNLERIGLSKLSKNLIMFSECNSKKELIEDKFLTQELKELERILPKTGSMKYNSANIAPYKDQIKRIINHIKEKEEIKPSVELYKAHLEKEIEEQIILYGGTRDDKYKTRFYEDRINQLDSRIGNMILANIKNYRDDIESYEKEKAKIEQAEEYQEYKVKRVSTKAAHNIRTRSKNIIGGVAREIGDSIERSFYSQLRNQRMISEVQRRAAMEAAANRGGISK